MCRSFPVRWSAKLGLVALPILAVILASCGGGGSSEPSTQTVQGAGYRFEAPALWKVTHTRTGAAAESGKVRLIQVTTFKLVRPYDARRFGEAKRELDTVISKIAAQLGGHVTSRRTVFVDGRRARSYAIAYKDKIQQITFVLRGRSEHQLICRRPAGDGDETCTALLKSFVLR